MSRVHAALQEEDRHWTDSSPAATALVELAQVVKRYDGPQGPESVTVLSGVSLAVGAGETVAVVGPSGSGKSTLLNLIGALDRPTSGQVRLAGRDLAGLSDRDQSAVRSREIGFVFQLHHLLPQCTVFENVLLPTLALGRDRAPAESEERAARLFDRVGLKERMEYRPGRLSGGEQQRVAVVRALINRPRLLLADEPTGSLDQTSAESLAQLLLELNREERVALIVVTHALTLARRMGRLYRLRNGRLEEAPATRAKTAGRGEDQTPSLF